MNSAQLKAAAGRLLEASGLHGDFDLYRLTGGINNRVFRVDANGSTVLLKQYFQHPDDTRDRIGAEFAFSSFAWNSGLRSLPQPLACDRENRLALYEYVEGTPVRAGEADERAVHAAMTFYREINRDRDEPEARDLPVASEACFGLGQHLERIERRVQALRDLKESLDIEGEAVDFISHGLSRTWETTREEALTRASAIGLSLASELSQSARCVSPSDFGFHNALAVADGTLRFIDFEYAGWDDPAKMVCDFFCQPAVPVPMAFYDEFVVGVQSSLRTPNNLAERIALLMPAYRVKWCCIMLNDFLPWGDDRRRFASRSDDSDGRARQLEQARRALAIVTG